VELGISGTGPDGYDYAFDVKGSGKLTASTNTKTGLVKTTISLSNGAEYGVYQDSDNGVSSGGFNLQGSGIPPIVEPYSTFWYFDISNFGS
jgi:hypothetical protein